MSNKFSGVEDECGWCSCYCIWS